MGAVTSRLAQATFVIAVLPWPAFSFFLQKFYVINLRSECICLLITAVVHFNPSTFRHCLYTVMTFSLFIKLCNHPPPFNYRKCSPQKKLYPLGYPHILLLSVSRHALVHIGTHSLLL